MTYEQLVEESIEKFGAVFSKPQFDNFRNFVSGIIKTEHRRTIFHINEGSETMKDQSQLNRFVTHPKWDQPELKRSYVDFAIKKVIDRSGKYVFFVFDETIKEVSTGNSKIEAIGKYFDHSQNRFVYGHKVFTACHVSDRVRTPAKAYPNLFLYLRRLPSLKSQRLKAEDCVDPTPR